MDSTRPVSTTPSIGLIGAGRWGWNLARTLKDLGALVSVCDPDAEVRDRVLGELPDVAIVESAEELITSDVEAVVIATPAATHAGLAVEALRGRKHVLVEKPFTLNVQDAERVVREAQAAQRIVMVGHLLLYQPAIVWLRDYLATGAIGVVATFYQDRLNLGTVRTTENALWSLGVHDVAALLYLVGDVPVRTTSWGQAIIQPGVQDDMHLHMAFPSGQEAHIHNSWLWPEQRRRLTIIGTEAMVVYDESDQTVRLHRRRVASDLSVIDEGSETLFHGDPRPLRFEIEHFLDCLVKGQEPRSSGVDSIPVVRVLADADRQLKEFA